MITQKQGDKIREEKMLREILVIRSSILYKDFHKGRPGFIPYDEIDFENIILQNYEYKQRGKVEEDLSFQQPIPYVIIRNPSIDRFIAYQRGNINSPVAENRLYGKRSLGVGGHIEKEQETDENPIYSTVFKEIEEEIGLTDITNINVLGYIVDDSDPVNLYHIGIIYIAQTQTTNLNIVDGEMEKVYFLNANEIEDIITSADTDLESRSYIARKAYNNSIK